MIPLIHKTRRLKVMKNKTRSSKNGGARAAYKYKSKSKQNTNIPIKDLPEDVMKYSMGFIRPALDNKSIRKAVKDYIEDGPKKKAVIETYGKIENWDTSRVTDMSYLFKSTKINEDISNWDVSNVTDMAGMFAYAVSFNQPIGGWDVSNVTNMEYMFSYARYFNKPIGGWNVSKVTDMEEMFRDAINFNSPINKWDVSNVKNMNRMFEHNFTFRKSFRKFNKKLTTWGDKLPKNANVRGMFDGMKPDIIKKIAPWYSTRN